MYLFISPVPFIKNDYLCNKNIRKTFYFIRKKKNSLPKNINFAARLECNIYMSTALINMIYQEWD